MKRALLVALKLGATVLVTVFVLRAIGLSLDEVGDVDLASWSIRWIPLLGSGLVLLAGYFASAALWGRMVVELGGPKLSSGNAIRLFMIANLGRYVPGKVWQIAGLTALATKRGVPPAISAAAAVLGQLVALAGATIVGLTVFFAPGSEWREYGEWAVTGALVVALAISIPSVLDALVGALARISGREAPTRRYGRSTFGVRWLAWYTLNWGLYAAAFWLFFLGLQPFEPFASIGPAFAAAYVVGYVALFAPAGAGIRESVLIVLLSPVVSPSVGAAVAVLARLWTTAVELVPAGAFWATEATGTEPGGAS